VAETGGELEAARGPRLPPARGVEVWIDWPFAVGRFSMHAGDCIELREYSSRVTRLGGIHRGAG
jgi:hypothetical protein